METPHSPVKPARRIKDRNGVGVAGYADRRGLGRTGIRLACPAALGPLGGFWRIPRRGRLRGLDGGIGARLWPELSQLVLTIDLLPKQILYFLRKRFQMPLKSAVKQTLHLLGYKIEKIDPLEEGIQPDYGNPLETHP